MPSKDEGRQQHAIQKPYACVICDFVGIVARGSRTAELCLLVLKEFCKTARCADEAEAKA